MPYAGRGLALSGGVIQKPTAQPAPQAQPAPAQPGTVPDGQAPASQTTSSTPPPAALPAPTTPSNSGNEATFFVGGTWTTPFVSPITRRKTGE
ncbi:hypothetical protein ACFJIU_20320 [Mesorhizobium sp. UC74_2]|uniref:hypothetical protein n=1 Tax=Mesorhizobium sp. UC74_2 TaxID=3350171 RepID=UPI00366A8B6B